MLQAMHVLALKTHPIRLFFPFAALSLFSFCIYIVVSNSQELSPYLLPSLVAFGWSCCLYGISTVFVHVPERISSDDNLFRRLKKRLRRALAWVIACAFTLCTLGLFYISYMAFRLSFQ